MGLSVCIISKNEEKTIGNCLLSLKPLVDAMPDSEIVVIDTGSNDRTRK